MYIDQNEIREYPFYGEFYREGINEDLPLDEQTDEKVLVFETDCDIVESKHTRSSNFITSSFTIYFPFDKDSEEIVIRNGDSFIGYMYGLPINGVVVGVFPSQLNGCTVYVQDNDI